MAWAALPESHRNDGPMMTHSGVYRVASADIVFESFDGDSVVLDLATGRYFGFSDSGSCIWEALSSGISRANLLGLKTKSGAVSSEDLEAFVDRLLELKLLAHSADSPAATISSDLADRLAMAAEPLKVDVYDDLADLVMVDPIHDVDEPAGWPAVKAK